ncbi:MAG: ECF transporter S component [Clostridia bacterium]|nr:ECF transporter S component [Clostridia bacterium]
MKSINIRRLVMAALCLALCLYLPFLTGQIPQIGQALSPMHIPVLLCGFLCGWPFGLGVGAVAPVLRYFMFGMPPLFPTGVAMAAELAVYGFMTGFLYARLPKKTINIYVALIISMLAGRVVWGVVQTVIAGASGSAFGWAAFFAGAFTNAVPGIICHILLIPVIVIALKKAGILHA